MATNSFTVLGSSSGAPNPKRSCSGYMLKTGESLSLIDCGSGIVSSLLREGFDPMKLDRVFISHTHADHVSDLALLIGFLHGLSSGRSLALYLPEEFVEPFKDYLNAVYLIRDRLRLQLEIHGYTEGFTFAESFRLTAIGNTHMSKTEAVIRQLGLPNKMQSHCFRLDAGGKTLLYSADIGSFEDIRQHLIDLDYAFVETTHVNVELLIEQARSSSVGKFVLTHLGSDDEVEQLRRQIDKSGVANVSIAYDGMRFEL